MSARKGGLYRINEQGEQELVHRSRPGGINASHPNTKAPTATATATAKKPVTKAKSQETGGKTS